MTKRWPANWREGRYGCRCLWLEPASAGTFKIGNTGLVKRYGFKITDARLDSKRQSALRLSTDKDVDFALVGMFLRKDAAP